MGLVRKVTTVVDCVPMSTQERAGNVTVTINTQLSLLSTNKVRCDKEYAPTM